MAAEKFLSPPPASDGNVLTISVTLELVLKTKSNGRSQQTPLGRLVARFMTEMHRYDGGRTLPVLHASRLTTPQLAVLELVRTGSIVSGVAKHLGLSRPATSQMVQKLVERGLVLRAEGAEDRRERALVLSPQGQALLDDIAAARAERFESALAVLPPRAASCLKSGLVAAIDALHRAPIPQPKSRASRRTAS